MASIWDTLRGGAGKINSLLYPGMLTAGDPQAAQAAASQAMMQMGAGLLGGAPFGAAYGTGAMAGNNALEQFQRTALLKQREQERLADLQFREWQKGQAESAAKRQSERDAFDVKRYNRERLTRRFESEEDKRRWEADQALDEQRLQLERQRLYAAQTGEGRSIVPTLRDIVDPTNPKQLITVDARTYQGGGMGAPGVLGVAGKEPTAAKAAESRGTGKDSIENIVAELSSYYEDLDKANAITDPDEGALTNAAAYVRSSPVGQATGKLFGTKEQSARNKIQQLRPRLLSAIMQATGMSARQLDSNAELKLQLSAATDPTLDVSANRQALRNISLLYGRGGDEVPRITTDEEFDALPKGTEFIDPEGNRRKKQ